VLNKFNGFSSQENAKCHGISLKKKNKPGLPSEIKYFLNDSPKGNTII
jgi:hypothetical protein